MGILAHDFPFKLNVTSENYRVWQEQNLDQEEHEVVIFFTKNNAKAQNKDVWKKAWFIWLLLNRSLSHKKWSPPPHTKTQKL